ncbi:MAG: thermonuclease family protein, partial [Hyphomicrobium sp.]
NVLSSLLESGATCKAGKKENRNRWVADCTLFDNKDLAREMVTRGFACSTKQGREFRSAELEARKLGVGLWSSEWGDTLENFPSKQCIVTSRKFKRHLQYLQFKSQRQPRPAEPAQ